MTALPTRAYLIDPVRTGGEMKTALGDQRDVIAQLLGGAAPTTLTLATDVVTPTGGMHLIDTQAAAATDDLSTITQTNLPDGSVLVIACANSARVVTVKHNVGGTGKIILRAAVDFVLDDVGKWLFLRRNGAQWEEIDLAFGHVKIAVLAKTGAYTAVGADNGKLIDCTSGTFTLSLTAAATLGAGWWIAVKAGSGTVTIDPNSTEQIDGATTLTMAPGDEAILVCTGSAFRTIARYLSSASLGGGSTTLTSGDVSTTSATLVSVTGLAVTFTKNNAGTDVLVGATFEVDCQTATQAGEFDIQIDGTTNIFADGSVGIGYTAVGNNEVLLSFNARVAGLGAGSHTFQMRFRSTGGATTLVRASTTRKAHMWAKEAA